MKFGRVDDPQNIDFSLPPDHIDTKRVLQRYKDDSDPDIYIGCAKWNRSDLKGFYPKGTKDELTYYSRQFNSIELNATFYRIFPETTVEKWYDKTPDHFRFFPKLYQDVSHWKRLQNTTEVVAHYLDTIGHLKHKLGTIFIQMHSNFAPKDFDRVVDFVESWPKQVPLAMEFRHTDWYNDTTVAEELYELLETNDIANIIVDTAGRRDLMHMRLTNHMAFVRYVGTNHSTDYGRLDEWVERLKHWSDLGIKEINFFIHQHIETASPLLSAYFIEELNDQLGLQLQVPVKHLN